MSIDARWKQLQAQYNLTDHQIDQYKRYLALLMAWNERMNLTAITEPVESIALHFQDSLEINHVIDLRNVAAIADIGTGAGFPGLPLKIQHPHITLYLIEVNQKKVQFLEHVIQELGLENVEIYLDDWRTFLRQTSGEIDLFCARASLQPKELIRLFKPVSPYKDGTLVYWAAGDWKPEKEVAPYITQEYAYHVLNKKRKLVIMRAE